MNLTLDEGKKLASEIIQVAGSGTRSDVHVILIPPFIHLTSINDLIDPSENIYLGAQNCHEKNMGAYTGEVSAAMLESAGVSHVIVGHSERREYFHESDEKLAEKVKRVLERGLIPVFCCGEKLKARNTGEQEDIVRKQIEKSLLILSEAELSRVVIAYEPVWTIGTGKAATANLVQQMHAFIRKEIVRNYNQQTADSISIIYGGSLKPANAREIFSMPDVDGGLIGGASLKSGDFMSIARAMNECRKYSL